MTDHDPSDADLIAAVRTGETSAFDVLYRRHLQAARRMARALVRDAADVDDLVAEAFARLLGVLSAGGGPEAAFRPYLLTTIRNLFYERVRLDRRVKVTDDPSPDAVPFVDTAVQRQELAFIARAFAKLPERWQEVLWHTEVEQERPASVAPLLGLSPNGVSALAYRAREGLRQQYLQEHLSADPDDECRWAAERLGAYVRDGLARREHVKVDEHLSGCARCHVLFVELGEVNAGLREILGTAVLAGSAGGYLTGSSATAAGAFWPGFQRVLKRRSTQAAAVVAALLAVAIALALMSQPGPVPPKSAPPPVAPPPVKPIPPPPLPSTAPTPAPSPDDPSATPSPAVPESAPLLEAGIEPVGALVRGRPGVLAMTVSHHGIRTVAFGPRGFGPRGVGLRGFGPSAFGPSGVGLRVPDTGPLTARLTVPDGVTLAPGSPGDGWQCETDSGGIICRRAGLPSGRSTRAYIDVDISATASDGELRVRLTAPGASATSASRLAGVQTGGLSAAFAATVPATVVTGGNTLMSCARLPLLGCLSKGPDNGDHYMTAYRDPDAPSGAPAGAAVSGAQLALGGEVLWAGLYWAGSGNPPDKPTVHVRPAGGDRYHAIRADRVDRIKDFTQPAYQATAEVTDLIRRDGAVWVAAEHAFTGGVGSFGGWALIVVVKTTGPVQNVAVLDGYLPLRGHGSAATPVYGAPGARVRLAFIGWEGDRGLTGDRLTLGGQPLGGVHSDNIASSHADGTPQGWNTFGVDARVLEGRLPTGRGQPSVTASSTEDAWILGALAVASDANAGSPAL